MVRNNDGTGSLKVVQPLDYEDELQRQGFRFRIQVNDKDSKAKTFRLIAVHQTWFDLRARTTTMTNTTWPTRGSR